MFSSKRTSRATLASSSRSVKNSDTTLTPALDGSSEYQAYLDKSSSIRAPSVESPAPTVTAQTCTRDPTLLTSRPTTANTHTSPRTSHTALEPIRPARARRQKVHRVERAEDPQEYPGPIALSILTFGICASVFLVSLDRTIVATVRLNLQL